MPLSGLRPQAQARAHGYGDGGWNFPFIYHTHIISRDECKVLALYWRNQIRHASRCVTHCVNEENYILLFESFSKYSFSHVHIFCIRIYVPEAFLLWETTASTTKPLKPLDAKQQPDTRLDARVADIIPPCLRKARDRHSRYLARWCDHRRVLPLDVQRYVIHFTSACHRSRWHGFQLQMNILVSWVELLWWLRVRSRKNCALSKHAIEQYLDVHVHTCNLSTCTVCIPYIPIDESISISSICWRRLKEQEVVG